MLQRRCCLNNAPTKLMRGDYVAVCIYQFPLSYLTSICMRCPTKRTTALTTIHLDKLLGMLSTALLQITILLGASQVFSAEIGGPTSGNVAERAADAKCTSVSSTMINLQ